MFSIVQQCLHTVFVSEDSEVNNTAGDMCTNVLKLYIITHVHVVQRSSCQKSARCCTCSLNKSNCSIRNESYMQQRLPLTTHLTEAPFSNSILTHSAFPLSQAYINGVKSGKCIKQTKVGVLTKLLCCHAVAVSFKSILRYPRVKATGSTKN